MTNINKALGIAPIMQDPARLEALKQHIIDNTRYVIPGYEKDYYLHTINHEVEFELCRYPDGREAGIAVHASGHNEIDLVFDKMISTEDSAHFYLMHAKNSVESIPVRVVCPDVLAGPKAGDIIHGQVVAFTEEIALIDEAACSICDAGDNCIRFTGKITQISEYDFEFGDVTAEYWDMDVNTSIGTIAVIVRKDAIDFTPEEDQFITGEAVVSFDVAVEPKTFNDAPFARNYYEDAAFESEHRLSCGFIPHLNNALRVLAGCIEKCDFNRFRRACANIVEVKTSTKESIDNSEIVACLKAALMASSYTCEVAQVISGEDAYYSGHNILAVTENDKICTLVYISVNNSGFVDAIHLLNPAKYVLGADPELHALAVLGQGMCSCKANTLREILTEKCIYRSEYADRMSVGASRIIDRLNEVAGNLDETNQYTYEILPAEAVLRSQEDLPVIYSGKWCAKEYQGNKLAAVIFIQLDENGRITNILLSRNGNYIKDFEKAGSSEAVSDAKAVNVRNLLESFYGKEDTLKNMRNNDTPDEDADGVYVWKEADAYAKAWLRDSGYTVSAVELEDDCIGYACTRKGKEFAVFVYAYGKQKQVQLDADYCQCLKTYPISENRTIVIVYLQVETVVEENGDKKYRVGKFNDTESAPEAWMLESVNGQNVILFYPREEIFNMVPRLMVAYNTRNLDLLKALCTADAELENFEGGCSLNDGFYSHLSTLYENYGKMRTAYVRYNDVVYSKVPYLDNYCYISFSVTNDTDRICHIKLSALDDSYRELLITDEALEQDSLNQYPGLISVDFIPASEASRFSARLSFSNGEVRRYDFPITGINAEDAEAAAQEKRAEIVEIGHVGFTDKIFQHGKIVEHIEMPGWMGYRNYPQRGQGLSFVNGYSISTAELYFNSYPIETFSYLGMEDKVFVKQYDYDEDGYGVGRISNLNPSNPLYLLNKNTMIAKELPEKYQQTEIGIYPFYGGYSEGRVMVSLMGELDLQYHHNRTSCAGMWGWLDTELKEVIAPQYVYALNFSYGQAIVCKGEWDVKEENGRKQYWCENEQWGVIDTDGKEIVPCAFDELYEVEGTDRLFFVHEGGWESGNYAIYDTKLQKVILKLDFDFDIGYMFNECFVADGDILVFVDHLPGEGTDLLYAYDLHDAKYIAYKQEYTERTYNGEKKVVVNKDGQDIIVF